MLGFLYLVLFILGLPVFIGAIYLFVLTVEAFCNAERKHINGWLGVKNLLAVLI